VKVVTLFAQIIAHYNQRRITNTHLYFAKRQQKKTIKAKNKTKTK